MKEGENFMTCITEGVGKEVLGEYLECACGGNMSCSTCHVILDEVSYSKLSRPCQAERDMLDLAFEPTRTSRLGCQIIITRDIDGMTVTIPSGVNNMWT
jgi:2Fe-2S ferredoxin